jgi:hypothetical protein
MKPVYLFLILFVFVCSPVFAQHEGRIRGMLADSLSRQSIADATINILDARDSSLIAFSRTGSGGKFQVAGLPTGKLRILITHVGYPTFSRNFFITDIVRELNLDTIFLNHHAAMLDEVTVEQEKPPVSLKNDTIEYNAGSFKTKPNAVVEDLLKKMPGIKVDKNGTIKANGEEVKKVLVDGKEFFGKDPKIASKNLPADAVEKVQVFDKKSDQSEFTGFDDGNKEKTINLTIKQEKKNGLFGKAMAGAGDDSRYEGKVNINQFKGNRQLSVLGMANNTNKQGFSFQDVMNFTGGFSNSGARPDAFNSGIPIQGLGDNNQAITTLLAGGINYNDAWNKKNDFTSSYFYNRADDHIDQKSTTQYLLPDNAYRQDQQILTNRHNENNRFSIGSDYKFDSANSVKFYSSFIQQKSTSTSQKNYSSHDAQTNTLLNDGSSSSIDQGNGYSWNTNALFRHRFRKKGRTISANLSFGLNDNKTKGNLYSVNHFYNPVFVDTLNQHNNQSGNSWNYGINLIYTEPLSRKSLLEFTYNFNQIHSVSDKKTFDADVSGKYTVPNLPLTNNFDNLYSYNRPGISFRNQQNKFSFELGAMLEEAALNNKFRYLAADSFLNQHFLNLLPHGNLQVDFNKFRHLRVFYSSFTRQPSVTQLQPVADNADPLNIKLGNPDLQQEYYHAVRMNYSAFDPFRHTGFFVMLSYNGIHNKIVNDDEIGNAGVRVTKPVNLTGLFNTNADATWTFPIRKIKTTVNVNSTVAYDHNASLVNGARNNSNNWTISEGMDLSYFYKEKLDITAGAKIDYADSRYSLQPGENQINWTQNYNVDFNLYLPKGFSLATDLNYTHRTGLTAGYDVSPLIWNAGIAKQLFKNKKAEIRLQVFDILKQNIGISRNTNQNYIQDISYQTLNRYWLLSFTYNINRFAGKSISGGSQPNNNVKVILH